MDDHGEALDPSKNYSAQQVKDILDAQKAKHEQDIIERINKLMESKLTEMLDKWFTVSAVVVSSPMNPAPRPKGGIPLGGTTKGATKDGSSSSYNANPYTYPPAYVPMPHMNPSGNPPNLMKLNFPFGSPLCVLIFAVYVRRYGEWWRTAMSPWMKETCHWLRRSTINSSPLL
jgi:hypothetical protein